MKLAQQEIDASAAALAASQPIGRVRPKRGAWVQLKTFARSKPLGAVSGALALAFVVIAVFGPLVTATGPNDSDYTMLMKPPSPAHVMGTDDLGRDILTRVIYGARTSLAVGLIAAIAGTLLGSIIGAVSGFLGGFTDSLIQRVMDAIMAMPLLMVAMVMVAVLGPALVNVILALALILIPGANRVVRGSVLAAREELYVTAAESVGAMKSWIIWKHILPNVMAPIIVLMSVSLGNAIVTEASLSFLGLGSPPPSVSWGQMLNMEGRANMERAPWIAIFPGLAISVVVLAFNLLGDALRDVLDPRLRGR